MTSDLPPTGGSQPSPEPTSAGPSGPAHSGPAAPAAPGPAAPDQEYPPSGHGSDDFFNRIRATGATRPDDGRWIAGVAAGLARRWEVDPILVRGGFVALTFAGGLGVVLYGLAWLLLPQDDGRIHVQQAIRGDITIGFVGALILSLAAIGSGGGGGPWHDGFWFNWSFPGALILAALVVFGIWWLAKRETDGVTGSTPSTWAAVGHQAGQQAATASRQAGQRAAEASRQAGQRAADASRQAGELARIRAEERTAAAKARRARTGPSKTIVRLTLGIALLTAAAILVIGNANDWSEPVGLIAAASALAVVATGVIVSGLNGRRAAGLAGVGLLLTVGVLAGAGADNAGVRSGQNLTVIGDTVWRPSTPSSAESQFNLGVGEGTLWLTNPAILRDATEADPLEVNVRVGAGHLTVIVPDSVSARLDVAIAAGNLSYPDGNSYRFNDSDDNYRGAEQQRVSTGPAGSPRLIVDIQQGAGEVDLRTASGTSITTIPAPSPTASPGSPPATPAPAPTATTPAAKATATPAPTT
jgi:phage shock protein PspC (stress-responsive transcriptional regulator)